MSRLVLVWIVASSMIPSCDSELTDGVVWQRGEIVDVTLKAEKAVELTNVQMPAACALHCAATTGCSFFFHSQVNAICRICNQAKCDWPNSVLVSQTASQYTFYRRKLWKSCPVDHTYNSTANTCLRYDITHDAGYWWYNARRRCLLGGGHLVLIRSDQKYEALKAFLNETLTSLQSQGEDITAAAFNRPWLGGRRSTIVTDQWLWDDGSLADHDLVGKWDVQQGEPQGGGAQDKLTLSATQGYLFHNDNSQMYRHFVCEIDVAL
ncbi:uncharacterized protein [Littorina saxatilis]|uniref:C-type lectin domain-containing protein n=1 Tax=Littorina saxatilis TaxID=31220 RepID=A0AAN9GCH9_9CAEN